MILKLRVTGRPHAVHGGGGWTYIDGVARVDTHETPLQENGDRRAFTGEGLVEFVAASFGPERDYSYELWPQDMGEGFCRYAVLAVVRTYADRCVLVVATAECFLLGDNGQTIDRLY